MEYPKGLAFILLLLTLGACFNIFSISQFEPGWAFGAVILGGQIAAMVGILKKDRTGWFMAIGFFGVIIVLNIVGGAVVGGVAVLRLIPPVICFAYLFFLKDEFG